MIEVTKLGGGRLIVNADHIECVEAQPDTVLVLTNGKHILVREEVGEIVRRVVEYQRMVRSGLSAATPHLRAGPEEGSDGPGSSGLGSSGLDVTKAED